MLICGLSKNIYVGLSQLTAITRLQILTTIGGSDSGVKRVLTKQRLLLISLQKAYVLIVICLVIGTVQANNALLPSVFILHELA